MQIRYKGIKLSQYKTVYIKKHQLGSAELVIKCLTLMFGCGSFSFINEAYSPKSGGGGGDNGIQGQRSFLESNFGCILLWTALHVP